MKTIPLWSDQYPRPDDLPVSVLPPKTDVAVVGSGYTGLNAAITLAKTGVDVTVLEQETIGWGASSRHGTFASPSLKAEWRTIEKKYRLEKAQEFWRWMVGSIEHIASIVEQENIDCDLKQTGTLGLAVKESHARALEKHGQYLATTYGYTNTRYVPRHQLRAEIGSSIFFGGLTFDMTYRVHPAKYVFGLARAAARHGARLVEGARVTRISKAGNRYELRTTKGAIEAEKVLLATNGYTTGLVRQARNGILPIGSYMIATEPLTPELQVDICPSGRLFWDSKIYLNYFGLTPDGRAFIGGRANLSPNLDLNESGRMLSARLVEIFPQLAGIPVTHSWSGRLGVSFDQMPHIGQIDGLYYAYGYSGQGVAAGSHMGKEVGELIAGIRQRSLFLEIKHPRTFLAPLDRLYLPFVSAWFKFLDWVQ
ncbi:MAG: FAD-binding oxidoreductase [Anaerolineales bacterium]|nr:FAD-binding oxidoreductase [Anaerolineales bacterium]